MNKDFKWDIEGDVDPPQPASRSEAWAGSLRFWIIGLALLVGLVGGLVVAQHNRTQSLESAQTRIEAALDRVQAACLGGDGEGMLAFQAREPEWRAAQLRPEQFAAVCQGLTASRVQPLGDGYSASLTWQQDGARWQRLGAFTETPMGMVAGPAPATYWGPSSQRRHAWGTLVTAEADAEFADVIGRHVSEFVKATCASAACVAQPKPFTLELRPDFRQTAAPGLVYLPSPRLLALDEAGQPGQPFWEALEAAVAAQLTPGTIRFAVPPWLYQAINFKQEATLFMRENPDIRVEIVEVETLPEQPTADLAAYDGAAFTPTAEMVAAGLVRDITDFADTDPAFDESDFYEQIWQGAWWFDRMWMMPQAGQMRLLFFDCGSCDQEDLELVPQLHWTWPEMAGNVRRLNTGDRQEQTGVGPSWTGEWAFMDMTRDSLLAYAYGHQAACVGVVPAQCGQPLSAAEVAAALEWYAGMVAQGIAPDLAATPPDKRRDLLVNWQSIRRRAAVWVDDPVNYEHQLLFWRTGVVPFPGSDRFEGSTPLWVHGSFISQSSARPLDVWRWLVFLSERPLVGGLRFVPARPSVARQMGYWAILPRPLQEAMRAAFPFAHPVSFDDRRHFNRKQLDRVMTGELSPQEAALQSEPLRWFGR